MITLEEARAKVQHLLAGLSERTSIELAIDDTATRAEPWCWIFFYNSRTYIETGSFSHALTGNGPVVVERSNGNIHELTTARPLDEQLEELHRAVGASGSD